MSELSEKIRGIREGSGLSQADFAARIGVPKSKIQNVETGKQRVDHEFLTTLAVNFTLDLNELLLGSAFKSITDDDIKSDLASSNFISIPRFDVTASAGHGALAESEIGTGHYAFNRSWLDRRGLQPSNLAVIAVRGDSMEPELYDQDLILLDQSQKEPRDGDMYVVRYFDELFVKRVQKSLGRRYELLSSNRYYKPIEVKPDEATDLAFVGKVVASMHEW